VRDATATADALEDYALTMGDHVEVELLVTTTVAGASPSVVVPRIVEGRIVGATRRVLVLESRQHDTRVRWEAIALIRPAVTAHPATI